MKKIIQFSLKNKFAVWLLTLIIIAAGLYSGFNMKLETIPNINTPLVSVSTIYPGATPSEVANKVTIPLEKRIKGLDGVSVVSSSSFQNASSIQVEYSFTKDMDKAQQEIKEALGDVTLPDGVKEPDISRLSLNAFPILSLSASNKHESLAKLTKTIQDDVVPTLESIDGVSSVQISGQQVNEVQLAFKEDKLKQYGLDEETVKNIIKGSDVTFPLGLYNFSGTEKSVVLDGNITTIDDLKSLKIPVMPAQNQQQGMMQQKAQMVPTKPIEIPTIQLKDIADIHLVGQAESISRTNGETSIGVQIVKAQDANTVDVVNNVKEKIKTLESQVDGLHLVTIMDQGKPIADSVHTMLNKALFGALFAMLIILLFLRNIRTTFISVISIPLSILIAILALKQMDITLNIMTLGAMTVAIGRVVDDSIVVIENIFRRLSLKDEKLSGGKLIVEATREMFIPIMSSTIVTIAVFLPLGLVHGPIGELFLPFALTIVFALLASLLVAITVVPMLAHSSFKSGFTMSQKEKGPSKLGLTYKRILKWSLNHKWIVSGIAILMLVGSLFLVPVIGVSFLPSDEQKMVVASYQPAPGETLDQVTDIANKAEKYLKSRKGAKTIQYSVGGQNPMNPGQSNSALFFVEYDKDTANFNNEKDTVINHLKDTTKEGSWGSQDFSGGGSNNTLSVLVYGENISDITPVVKDIQKIIDKNHSLDNVKSSISDTYDEYTLVANQEKLNKLGLSAAQIGMGLSKVGNQQVLTTIHQNDEDINVYVEKQEEKYNDINDLTKKTIQSPLGISVPIKDVVDVKKGKTSDTIKRRDGRIYAEVSGEITTKDVAKVSKAVQAKVDKLNLPDHVDVSMGGVTEDIASSFTQLGLAMLAAIAIVYLILVITFGGALAPFSILFSLPFTIIGGLLGLLISGETLSISALIGALMLIGIVVTNAIVLIDRVIHKENEGLSTREALLEAGMTRVRPILMTAIATICALAPLAIGLEGSGLISKGLGVTVIGGLTSSTLLTLLIVPIVYESLMKLKRKNKKG